MATFTGTSGGDNFTGTLNADNLFRFGVTDLQGTDTVTGGNTLVGIDTLEFLTGGAIASAQFAGVTNIEVLLLSTAGNTVVVPASLANGQATLRIITQDGTSIVDASAATVDVELDGRLGSNNVLTSGSGADVLRSVTGGSLTGGAGDDQYDISDSATVITEAAAGGIDKVFTSADYVLPANVENMVLLNGADGTGNDDPNVIESYGDFDQTITGGGGGDRLKGGGGFDTMIGGLGDDDYEVTEEGDQVVENAGEGYDRVFTSINETLDANVEELVLIGTGAVEGTGNELDNTIRTIGDVANIIRGGAGTDTMSGGLGDDQYEVTEVGDAVVEAGGQGHDTVYANVDHTLADNVEDLVLADGVDGTGNAEDNYIISIGAGNQTLRGMDGNDRLSGGLGDDDMYGGTGNDDFEVIEAGDHAIENANEGYDRVFTTRDGYVLEANIEELVFIGAGSGTGNELDNIVRGYDSAAQVLDGAAGDDTVFGLGGADMLKGGTGDDTLHYDADDVLIDGGTNADDYDVLVPASAGQVVDLTTGATVTNIEVVDLRSGTGASLVLSAAAVAAVTDASKELVVFGDADNAVDLGSGWLRDPATYERPDPLTGAPVNVARYFLSTGEQVFVQPGIALTVELATTPVVPETQIATNEDTTVSGHAPSIKIEDAVTTSYTLVTGPANGTLLTGVNSTTGAFTYKPNDDFNGQDTFVVKVTASNGVTANATVTVTVDPENDIPVITGVTPNPLETVEDSPLLISFAPSDVDGDTVTAVAGSAQHGTLSLLGGTIVEYTPAANFFGTDTVTVVLSDGNGGSTVSNVTVTVTGENDAPTVGDATFTTNEDRGLAGRLPTPVDPDGTTPAFEVVSNVATTEGGLISIQANGSFTYTPPANFHGEDSFTYAITDGALTDTGLLTIRVNSVNDGPVAVNDTATVAEGASVNINVLANDSDPDNVLPTLPNAGLTIVTAMAHKGDVTISGGQITYTPDAHFSGSDTIQYVIRDADGGFALASVAVTVTGVNDAPVVGNAAVTTLEDQPVHGKLPTATDPDGTIPTYVTGTSATAHGSITINANGTYDYTPNANFFGTDTATFSVTDGVNTTNATLTIKVNPVNDNVMAVADTAAATEDGAAATGNVLTNDLDPDTGSNAGLSVLAGTFNGALGTLVLNADGTFSYTVTAQALGAGETATDTFTYTVVDASGAQTTSTLSIAVTGANDDPTFALPVLSVAVDKGGTLSAAVPPAFDADGDTLTYAGPGAPTANGGVVVITDGATGAFTYTPASGFHGADSFEVTVSDGHGGTDTITVNVAVLGGNEAPNVTAVAAQTTAEDTPILGIVITATDSDGGTPVIASAASQFGAVLVGPGLSIDYLPNENFSGNDTISVLIADGQGGFTPLQIPVTVTAVNDAPELFVNTVLGVAEGQTNVITIANLLADDVDTDSDDIVFTVTAPPSDGMLIINGLPYDDGLGANPANNTFTQTDVASGNILYVHGGGEPSGPDQFLFTVSDGTTTLPAQSFLIGVNDINDAPTATSVANQAAIEDAAFSFSLPALTFQDADLSDSLTLSAVNLPAWLSFNPTTGELSGTPTNADVGTTNITVVATDSAGATASTTFQLTVGSTNDAPSFPAVGVPVSLTEDGALGGQVPLATDPDAGDTLTYSVATGDEPANAAFFQMNSDGTYMYVPNTNYNGPDDFIVTVTDVSGLTDTLTVSIKVTPVNDAPAVDAGLTSQTATEDTAFTYVVPVDAFADIDDTTLTLTASGQPDWLTFDPITGTFSGTPANGDVGGTVTVTATDASGASVSTSFTLGVTPVNDAPELTSAEPVTVDEGAVRVLSLTNIIPDDVDGNIAALTFSVTSGPGVGHLALVSAPATAITSFTAAQLALGQVAYVSDGANETATATSFTVTATDAGSPAATSAPATVGVVITLINDDPTASAAAATTDEDTFVTIPVTMSDVDSGTLSIASADAGHGTVEISGSDLIYRPAANYFGADSITYTVTDGDKSVTQTVAITVNSVNDLPTVGGSTFTTLEDQALTGRLAAITDIDSASGYAVATYTGSLGGTLDVSAANGTYTYTPLADASGQDVFTVTVTDPAGGSVTSTVRFNVMPVNDEPSAAAGTANATEDGGSVAIDVAGLIADTETPDASMVVAASVPGAQGTVTVAGTVITFTPAADFNGSATITYTATDASGAEVTNVIQVAVAPSNDAPVAADDVGFATSEDTPLIIDPSLLTGNDTDIDGDALTVTAVGSATGGTVALVSGNVVFTPTADYTGPASFTYTVSDGTTTDTATVSLTVNPVNDAPVITDNTPTAQLTTDEDTATNLSLSVADSDSASITVVLEASNGRINVNPGAGAAVVTPSTQLVEQVTITGTVADVNAALSSIGFVPNENYKGPASVGVSVSDGATTSISTVNLTVTSVNDAPTLISGEPVSVDEGAVRVLSLTNIIPDDVDGNIAALTFSVTSGPGVGHLALVSAPATAITSFTAAQLASGQVAYVSDAANETATATSFTVTATDAGAPPATSAPATVGVVITLVNDAPTASAAAASTNEDTFVTIPVTMSDVDSGTLSIASADAGHGTVEISGTDLIYRPAANYFGADSITYTVSDGDKSVTQTLAVTVNSVNDLPTVGGSTFTTLEDQGLTGRLAAITDIDSASGFDVTSYPGSLGGTLTVTNANGAFTYTPAANASGQDVFTVTVTDPAGGSVTSTVRFNVMPVNDAPVAIDNVFPLPISEDSATFSGTVGGTLPITFATDVDSALTSSSFTFTGATINGIPAATLADAGISYVPTSGVFAISPQGVEAYQALQVGQTAIVVVSFSVSDGDKSDTGTVTFTVNGANDAPTLSADTGFITSEDTPLVISPAALLANDSDIDGGTLAVISVQGATGGTVSMLAGNILFTPTGDGNGPATFTYTVEDGQGGTTTETVSLYITPVNDAPVVDATLTGATPVDEGTLGAPVTVGSFTVTDPDGSGPTFTVSDARFEVVSAGGGDYELQAKLGATFDFEGEQQINVLVDVSDGGTSVSRTFTVDVTNIEEGGPSFFIGATAATVAEDTPLILGPYVAEDPDQTSVSYTLSGADAANFSISTDGVLTFLGADFEASSVSGDDIYSVTVVATSNDIGGGTSTGTRDVAVTVTNVNETPSAITIATPSSVAENTAGATTIGALSVTDGDGADTFTWTVNDDRFEVDGSGNLVLKAGNALNFETTPTVPVTVTATDAGGLSYSKTFTITVTDVNEAPVAADVVATVLESVTDAAVLATVAGTDPDAGASLTYSIVGGSSLFEIDSNGQISLIAGQSLDAETATSHTLSIEVSDGTLTDTATVVINVANVADNPISSTADSDSVSNSVSENAAAGTLVGITALATDADLGATVTYSLTSNPGGLFAIDAATGVVRVATGASLNYETATSHTIQVTATSTAGDTSSASFTISVTDANEFHVSAPADTDATANSIAENAAAGTAVGITLAASDADATTNTVTYTLSDDRFEVGAGGVVQVATGATFNYNAERSIDLTVTATSADGSSATNAFRIAVTDVNNDPTSAGGSATTNEDTTAFGLLSASDADGDALTFSVATGPSHGTLVLAPNGLYIYTPAANYNGSDSFTYQVSDGHGGTLVSAATVSLTINPVNDLPIAVVDTSSGNEDTSQTITVLTNDTDSDGSTLSVTGAAAGHGTVIVNGDNTLTYTPTANWSGTDSIVYTISDGQGGTATGSVTVTVNAVDDPAVAGNDAATLVEDVGVTTSSSVIANVVTLQTTISTAGNVLGNDGDVEAGAATSVTGVTGGTMTAADRFEVAGTLGTLVMFTNGQYVYYANNASTGIQEIGLNDSKTETFTYTNNQGQSATLTITIRGTNDGPTTAADYASINENSTAIGDYPAQTDAPGTLGTNTFTIDVLANDFDIDRTDTSTSMTLVPGSVAIVGTPSIVSGSAPTNTAYHGTAGTVAISGNDVLFTPGTLFDQLDAGDVATVTISYTVRDAGGLTSPGTLTLQVTGSNDGPVLTGTSFGLTELTDTTGSATTLTQSGALSFTDVDLDDNDHTVGATVTASGVTTGFAGAALGYLTLDPVTKAAGSSTGSVGYSFSAPDNAFDYLGAGEQLVLTYTVTIDDHNGGTDTKDIVVTITGSNDRPVISTGGTNDFAGSDTEDSANLAGNLTDTGTFAYTDTDLTDTHPTVTVTALTPTVSAGTIPAGTAAALATALTAVETDVATGDGNGAITWSFELANSLAQFLAAGEVLTAQYTVTVTDDSGAPNATSTSQTVTVQITGTNDAPVINTSAASDFAGSATEDSTNLSGNLADTGTIAFTDVDLTDTHTVGATLVSAVASGTSPVIPGATSTALATALATTVTNVSNGDGAGAVTWDFTLANGLAQFLADGQTLTVTYDVTVTDSPTGASDTEQVTIVITGTNDAPVVTAVDVSDTVIEDVSANVSGDLTGAGNVTFTDVDLTDAHTPTYTFVSSSAPGGTQLGTFAVTETADTTGTGTGGNVNWSYTVSNSSAAIQALNDGQTIVEKFNVVVSDGTLTDTEEVTITISGRNDAPVISSLSGDALAYTEGAGPLAMDTTAAASIADVDSANFSGGTLTVAITAGGVPAEDLLGIATSGSVALSAGLTNGSVVSVAGNAVGTITAASASSITVTFNTINATPAAAATLISAFTYDNTVVNNGSELNRGHPDPTTGARTITWTLVDGDGTNNGGADTHVVTSTVTVGLDLNQVVYLRDGGASGNIVGTFDTIQEAINSGVTSDYIEARSGYTGENENIVVTRPVTIDGVGAGTVLRSVTIADGALDSGETVTLKDLAVTHSAATTQQNGVMYEDADGSSDGTLTLDNVTVSGFDLNGLYVGNSVSPNLTSVTVNITGSTFSDNNTTHQTGAQDLHLFNFAGNATLTNVTVSNTGSTEHGIAIQGWTGSSAATGNVPGPIGTIDINNVTVTGTYGKTLVYINGYNELDGLDLTGGLNLGDGTTPTSAGWTGLYVQPQSTNGTYTANPTAPTDIDLTGVVVASTNTTLGTNGGFWTGRGIVVTGSTGNEAIVGSAGNDHLVGFTGGATDTMIGAGGSDLAQIFNALGATPVTFTITDTNAAGIGSGDDDLLVQMGLSSGGPANALGQVTLDGVEDLLLTLGSGGDTVVITNGLGGTSLATSTITITGGAGSDTAEIGAINQDKTVGVHFDGAGGIDTVSFAGADSDAHVVVNLGTGSATSDGATHTLTNVENVIGSSFADDITGSAADNVLTGGGGNDVLHGGAGTDRASYSGNSTDYTFTVNPATGIITLVDTRGGSPDGTDTIHPDVEQLYFAGNNTTVDLTAPVRVVSAAGTLVATYTTIAGAVAAASDGQTIQILGQPDAGPDFTESVTVDKALSFVGIDVGNGLPTISSAGTAFTLSGTIGGGTGNVSFTGLTITGAAASGIQAAASLDMGALTLTDISINNSGQYGLDISAPADGMVTSVTITETASGESGFSGNGYNAVFVDNAAGTVTISGSSPSDAITFTNNGTGGAAATAGAGDISLYQFNGSATLANLALTGNGAGSGSPASAYTGGQTGIQLISSTGGMGTVSISDVTVSGSYARQPIGIFNYDNIDGLTMTNVSVTADSTAYNTGINIDGITGNVDLSNTTGVGAKFVNVTSADVISVQGDGAAQTLTGDDAGNFIRGHDGADTLIGNGGDDRMVGDDGAVSQVGSGNDQLTGGAGNDTLLGEDGTDQANYTATVTIASITTVTDADPVTAGDQAGWQVATGGPEGTDLLNDIEIVQGADPDGAGPTTGRTLLVGNGGFDTIQAAVNAAANGDTILIAAGTYTEDLTITDKAISIVGSGAGVVVQGTFLVSDAMDTADVMRFENLSIDATGKTYGISVRSSATDVTGVNGGSIVLDGVSISNANEIGFFYAHPSNGSNPVNPNTVGSISILDSTFAGNGQLVTGARGQGHVNLFGFNGNLTVDTVTMTGPATSLGDSTFRGGTVTTGNIANPDKAFAVTGIRTGTEGVGGYVDAGALVWNDVTITGNYSTDVIEVNTIQSFASVSVTDVDITARGPWGLVNFDSVGGVVDLSGVTGTNSAVGVPVVVMQGLAGGEMFTASGGNDYITGRGGADTMVGGHGNDTYVVDNAGDVVTEAAGGGTDTVTASVSYTLAAHTEVENLTAATGTSGINLTGNELGQTITGNAGDNVLTGGAGTDAIVGGAGVDTAVYSDAATVAWNGSAWVVTSAADGTETLTDIEAVDFSGAGGARTLLVDQTATGGFATIQEAVNAAANGDTILIAAGTYVEQVDINGKSNLTIEGVGGTVTVKAPADVVETARSSSDREMHAVVTVENGLNVTLKNIDVDGDGRANTIDEGGGAGQANYVGVFYRNASGSVIDVDITGVRDPYAGSTTVDGYPVVSGNQRGIGIQVDNDTQLAFTMTGGSISDFQKNATVFSNANLNVTGVTITGGGAQTINAQNGIQVLNSTGTISGNTINAIGYAGAALAYSGMILAYGNTDLDITNNTITGPNTGAIIPDVKTVGIFVFDNGPDNSGGSITGNTISYVDEGIDVSGGIQPDGIAISNNTITNIDLADTYAAGVYHDPNGTLTTVFSVEGSAAGDFLFGAAAADTLTGLGGDDYIDGRGGTDTMVGGQGNDTYIVDNAGDVVTEAVGGGTDTVTASVSYTLAAGTEVENLTATTGTSAINLVGNELGQTITGNAGVNVLTGGGGADVIVGGAGADTAVYTESYAAVTNLTWNDATGTANVTIGGVTDTISGVGKLQFADKTVWLVNDNGETDEVNTLAELFDGTGDEAAAGDIIMLAAGTYTGNVTIDRAVTIVGANAGVPGTGQTHGSGAVIDGQITVSAASGTVTLTGLEFQNTSANGTQFKSIAVTGAADVVVSDNLFYSTGPNAGDPGRDRAIELQTGALGNVDITNNAFGGAQAATDKYSTANWGTAVWSDGAEASLDITGNTFTSVRTGLNLDGYSNATTNVSGNTFEISGSGISIGTPDGTAYTGISDNTFKDVDTDFNLQTVASQSVVIDLSASNNSAAVFGADTTGAMLVLTGSQADTVTGTSGVDILFGNGSGDTFTGGAGDDVIYGGGGADTASVSGSYTVAAVADADPLTAGNQAGWSVTSASGGTDLLNGVEIVGNGTGRTLLVGNGGFADIATAAAAASAGDTILVTGGPYTGDVTIDDADVTLISTGGPVTINGTITVNASGVTIGAAGQGFTVNVGSGANGIVVNGASDVAIHGNTIAGAAGANVGVLLNGTGTGNAVGSGSDTGSAAAAAGNTISGFVAGVFVTGTTTGTSTIQGNWLAGNDSAGVWLDTAAAGITVTQSTSSLISTAANGAEVVNTNEAANTITLTEPYVMTDTLTSYSGPSGEDAHGGTGYFGGTNGATADTDLVEAATQSADGATITLHSAAGAEAFGSASIAGNNVTVTGADGDDTASITMTGAGAQNLTLGGSADINVTGNGFANVITDNAGTNTINGAGGDDSIALTADSTADVVDGGAGTNDVLDLSAATGSVTAVASDVTSTTTSAANSGGLGQFTLSAIESLIGGSFADNLTGGGVSNTLIGGGGADILTGNDGADRIDGGFNDGANDRLGGFVNVSSAGDGDIDIFAFGRNFGTDRVTDFENGVDKLEFNVGSGGTVNVVENQNGANLELTITGSNGLTGTVILENTNASDIDASDWQLV